MNAATSYGSCRVDIVGNVVRLILISPHGAEVVCSEWRTATPEILARMVLRGEQRAHPVTS